MANYSNSQKRKNRWTPEQNRNKALLSYDLNENYKELLLNEIIKNNLETSVDIRAFIRNKIQSNLRLPKHNIDFWKNRGWPEDEAFALMKEHKEIFLKNKNPNNKSPFSKEYWVEKINPNTNKTYTLEEADFKRNSIRPIRKEYWMVNHNLDEIDAISKAKEHKNKVNLAGALASKNKPKEQWARRNSDTRLKYYLEKGLNEEDAAKALKKRQTTFSLEKCIEKYGEIEGRYKFDRRQEKWQNTMINKTLEEISRINKAKIFKSGISSIEKEFVLLLKERYEIETQFYLKNPNKIKGFLYDVKYNDKIIEFNRRFLA